MTFLPSSYTTSPLALRLGRSRRGAVLLIVLSILGLLVLFSTTLTYTSRLEVQSAANYRDASAARIAAASGLDASPPAMAPFTAVTALSQVWAQPLGLMQAGDPNIALVHSRIIRQLEARALASAALPESLPQIDLTSLPAEMQDLRVSDTSGRINLNAVMLLDGEGAGLNLAEFLLYVLEPKGLSRDEALRLAREIIALRYGPDAAPGLRGVDDNGSGPFARAESDGLDNTGSGTADDAEEALLTHATLDERLDWLDESLRLAPAEAPRKVFATGGLAWDRAVLYQPWSVREVTGPERFERGIGVDTRDEFRPDVRLEPAGDDTPLLDVRALLMAEGMSEVYLEALRPYLTIFSASRNTVIVGEEELPRLNLHEVTAEEFIERLERLYPSAPRAGLVQFAANVLDRRDLDRVPSRLAVPGAPGLKAVGLEVIPFITEVYPDSRTSLEDGDGGQFVEIHNPWDVELSLQGWSLRTTGATRVGLRGVLPPRGSLIVTDNYNDEGRSQSVQSSSERYGTFFGIFQEAPNQRSRQLIEAPELALADTFGRVELLDDRGNVVDEFRWSNHRGDGTTLSLQRLHPHLPVTQTLLATPFAMPRQAEAERWASFYSIDPDEPELRDRPFLRVTDLMNVRAAWFDAEGRLRELTPTLEVREDGPDSRLLDHFVLEVPFAARGVAVELERLSELRRRHDQDGWRFGKVNINTAPVPVLVALPGLDAELAERLVAERSRADLEAMRGERGLAPAILFQVPSDMLRHEAIWGGMSRSERLDRFGRLLPHISTSSVSFEVTSTFMRRRDSGLPGESATARALIVVDRERAANLLTFEYLP